ncbi:cellulose synthase operon protein YhjQ [Siccirubricoccus sp. KC 17139]|uniref:Cellulose synthase operon protein YhjQ n=1 Tax=Siccirubricoccus soli TaxID=2899147 RepID=A0ABT1D9Q0_9PROT|nr:cellulose biosynthesis protein BcsQ [Siccirubricoccus soli]MCO6418656.1 cellulose synthase operon protein YhjQ [Siccirubricoccus soli]MCP2684791.1 cellulose biosynthesis protein BcsQ [Siccirubricoccus soli]
MALICVCSPKGGVGKTMLAANIAHGLQRAGRRVLAVDLDPQNALRLHFGLPLAEEAGFAAGMERQVDWRAELRRTACGVSLLPYGALDATARLSLTRAIEADPERLAAPLREAAADPGLTVVVDTAPGVSRALFAVLPLADIILVPLLADGGSVATLPEIESGRFFGRGTMGTIFASKMRFVLNQVDQGRRLSASVTAALMRHLGPRLLGLVAHDEAVAEALACEALLADHAPRSRAACDLAEIVAALDAALPAANGAQGMLAGVGR